MIYEHNLSRSFAIHENHATPGWTSGYKNKFSYRNYFTFDTVFFKYRKIVTESNDTYCQYYVYSVHYDNKGLTISEVQDGQTVLRAIPTEDKHIQMSAAGEHDIPPSRVSRS